MGKLRIIAAGAAITGLVANAAPAALGAGADYATVKPAAKHATQGGRVRLLVTANFSDADEGGTVIITLKGDVVVRYIG